jgi:hypothetical protein
MPDFLEHTLGFLINQGPLPCYCLEVVLLQALIAERLQELFLLVVVPMWLSPRMFLRITLSIFSTWKKRGRMENSRAA